ncbi:MAG TPA: bifunctional oligoribonuclease/PAP phosphatase NrnA [Dissulfurispiraceae bacterium]|nr:bifunctional oligoribonuclease/PAP phosphatase NrnA [Dissulfurispiraceae bacterium]
MRELVSGLPPEHIVDFFKRGDGFFIAIHLNPDGDALGSACALGMALEKLGKRALLVCRDSVPRQYAFLPDQYRFLTFEAVRPPDIDISLYKNLVLVDCNDVKRTGLDKSVLSSVKFAASAVIDHHENEKGFDELKWIVPGMAAAGMMVYYLVKALGVLITEPMAVNLYAALVVDTGNFRFPNTSPEVLRVAADLAEAGANPYLIQKAINESWSEGRFRLFIKVLCTLSINNGIAITHATRKMFEETATTSDDTESFASFALTMKDIKVAVFIREVDEYTCKISLRSVEEINVQKVAASYGGGGHKNAAGCSAPGELETVKAEMLKRLGVIEPTIFHTTLQG